MPKGIRKALSSQEDAIIANIESLIVQLRQIGNGEGENEVDDPEEVVETAGETKEEKSMDATTIKLKIMKGEALTDQERLFVMKAMDEEEEDMEGEEGEASKASKKKAAKATASDSADDRIADDNEDTTTEAVDSEGENMKALTKAILKIAEKVETISAKSDQNAEAIKGLLDGMNLLEVIEKGESVQNGTQRVEKGADGGRPVVTADLSQILEIVKAQGAQRDEEEAGGLVESFAVRKSLRETGANRGDLGSALGAIFGVNNGQSGRF